MQSYGNLWAILGFCALGLGSVLQLLLWDLVIVERTMKLALSDELRQGLAEMLLAQRYAEDVQVGHWNYAVEIGTLLQYGATRTDLRWLFDRGYVEHMYEVTASGDVARKFLPPDLVGFSDSSCFVLTREGCLFAENLLYGSNGRTSGSNHRHDGRLSKQAGSTVPGQSETPYWNPDGRALYFQNVLIKQFKVPATNQELILNCFEEVHWPERIDDPLPVTEDIERVDRLRQTIVSLNRNRKSRVLRFFGDGKSEGVRWGTEVCV